MRGSFSINEHRAGIDYDTGRNDTASNADRTKTHHRDSPTKLYKTRSNEKPTARVSRGTNRASRSTQSKHGWNKTSKDSPTARERTKLRERNKTPILIFPLSKALRYQKTPSMHETSRGQNRDSWGRIFNPATA